MDIYISNSNLAVLDSRFFFSKIMDCNLHFLNPFGTEPKEHSFFLTINLSLTAEIQEELLIEKIKKIQNKTLFLLYEGRSLTSDEGYKGLRQLVDRCEFDESKIYIATQLTYDIETLKGSFPNANIFATDRWLYEFYEYYIKPITLAKKNLNLHESTLPIKKFSVFCKRYESLRFDFYCQLLNHGLLDNFYYTFACESFNGSYSDLVTTIMSDDIKKWVTGLPYKLPKISDGYEHPHYPHDLKGYLNSSLIHVSLETDPKGNSFLTEKTYRAMYYKKPFILVSQYKGLEFLKAEGYKTFEPYIDETYDTYEVYEDRVNAVIQEISRLNSLPIHELENIVEKCKEIVEHNFNKLFENIHRKIPENFLFSSISKTL